MKENGSNETDKGKDVIKLKLPHQKSKVCFSSSLMLQRILKKDRLITTFYVPRIIKHEDSFERNRHGKIN